MKNRNRLRDIENRLAKGEEVGERMEEIGFSRCKLS